MELSDKVKKIKQVSKSHDLTPQEARNIAEAFYVPDVETAEQFLDDFRACYKASNEKAEWCQYWRGRYSQRLGSAKGINERIRASIQADKQEAA